MYQATCPIDSLGAEISKHPEGTALFAGISPADALHTLRFLLKKMGVQKAREYRTHDLRRGHAVDLQLSKAPLFEILEAGEWKSPAFLQCLDLHRLERDAVVQAHLDESDDDEIV